MFPKHESLTCFLLRLDNGVSCCPPIPEVPYNRFHTKQESFLMDIVCSKSSK